MAKRQKQREAVAGVNLKRPRLRVVEPALGDEIVEERMQAGLADVPNGLQRQGEGDSRLLVRQIGCVVSEHATATRFLTQFARVEFVVVDLAPECRSHIKSVLYPLGLSPRK